MEFAGERPVKGKYKNVESSDNIRQQSRVEDDLPHQKLRRKSKHLVNVSQAISQTSTKEPLNKVKVDETPVAEVNDAKKAKKRKRKDTESEPKSQPKNKDEEPPTRKRKKRTEFADPREDSALNSQSRKALGYVFIQMDKPSKWKFNKARQNWIIRNVWSLEALPEAYFPLTLKYLSKIQGGSRLKLVEEAQTILHPKDIPPGKTVKFAEPSPEIDTSRVKPVPGSPTSTDLTPGPLIDSEPMSATNEPSSVDAKVCGTHALTEIKKTRAQKLLEVLSLNNENA